ncbi:hypothetical protein FQN52_008624 [Onygenales sp. PD_12]|nr:hypothetical protein FQN52_008624 [Onygenales sp. PD_12]
MDPQGFKIIKLFLLPSLGALFYWCKEMFPGVGHQTPPAEPAEPADPEPNPVGPSRNPRVEEGISRGNVYPNREDPWPGQQGHGIV